MLKTRLLTAFVAGPLLLASLFLLNTAGIAVLFGVFTAVAAFEWSLLAGLKVSGSVAFALAVVILGWASLWLSLSLVLIVASAWWLWALVEVFFFRDQTGPLWRYRAVRLLCGVPVLIPLWRGCVVLKAQDPGHPWLLGWVLVIVWTADSLAYFTGRAYGRHKLAPQVSPGKTLEGAAGGLAGAALVGAVGMVLLGFGVRGVLAGTLLGVVIAAFSVVGDLLESKAKRLAGVKDSGHWLPGHGGVLDRIDALTAAVPLFLVGIRWLGVR
ncbi:MAG TPA: phosphatidate cytidylyltransferase [Acidiferrobacter sp.]|nr:phosphatidate cytidylyltransferase [Acidiferrobacter sp.]